MISLDRRELYSLFLESDWWRDLSRRKRQQVTRCERCGSRDRLQAHHVRYPNHWFDTQLEDLKVLCRTCHEIEHGLRPAPKPVPKVIPPKTPDFVIAQLVGGDELKKAIWKQYNGDAPLASVPPVSVPPRYGFWPAPRFDTSTITSLRGLIEARSRGQIDRRTFLKLREKFRGQKKPEPSRKRRQRAKKPKPTQYPPSGLLVISHDYGHYTKPHKSKWINRGTSTN